MNRRNQRQSWVLTLFLVGAFLVNGLPLRAQDVVTSEDFTGGSSAFVFKTSRKAVQKKVAFRSTQQVNRTKTAKLETSRRITKQTVTVAKVNPKRTKSKVINPDSKVMSAVELKRKSPQETSVLFAGAGEYYLTQDDPDKAIEIFREAVSLDAKNTNAKTGLSEALTRKGEQLLTQEKYDVARGFYDEAISTNPTNAAALAGLAEIYSSKNETDNAILNYEKALALDKELTELNAPLGVLYYQKGEIDKSEAYLQKALALDADNAETQFFIGLVRYKQGRDDDAITAFRRSIQIDPSNAEVHYYLGAALDRKNNDKDAIAEYQKAVQLNPKYTEAWFDLGVAYFNHDQLDEAAAAYQEVIRLKPTYGEAHANLADVYRLQNKLDESIGEYRQATSYIKDDAELYSKFGFVAGKRAVNPNYQSFWKLSIENLEKAVAISPVYLDYTNLGWAYYNAAQSDLRGKRQTEYQANLQKAKAAFVKSTELNKDFAATYLNLGMTLTDLGDFQGAIDALKRATELKKDWLPAINELAIGYRKKGDMDNAVKQFRRAIEIDDNFGVAHYGLAETEYRRGNLKEAKKEYQKLKDLKRADLASQLEMVTSGGILK